MNGAKNKMRKLQQDSNALQHMINKLSEVPSKKQKLDNQVEINVNKQLDASIESLSLPPPLPNVFINTEPVTGKYACTYNFNLKLLLN